ncbi:MAG: hypothetical protein LBN11_02095 [Tannerella sp.]|jgi:hypothetical protein|nr:hypothetical protein [Tannerella sp.]
MRNLPLEIQSLKRVILLIVGMLQLALNVAAKDNLRIPDLRTLGMGGGGVTETPLFNPALLAIQNKNKLFANYYNRYSVSELATVNGGFYFRNDILPAGLDITSFGYDEYRESMFRLSFGKLLTDRFSLGVAIQYALLQSELFQESTGRISADIGLVYQPIDELMIGLSMLHVPSVHIGDENIENKHIAPYSMQLGFNYSVLSNMSIVGSAGHNKEDKFMGAFGVEYTAFEDFNIRAGLCTAPFAPSLGVGYKIYSIQADVGMVYHSILGTSMGIGISYSF